MNIQFQKGAGANQCTYPITVNQLLSLKPCRLVNPMVGYHHNTKIPADFDIVAATWEIDQVRKEVQLGMFPHWFMQKYYPFKAEFGEFPDQITAPLQAKMLSFANPKRLANIVHMDNPMDMPLAILDWLVNPAHQQKINVNAWSPNHINFLETIPHVNENIADGVKHGLDRIFEVKYFHGIARPEEVYKKITGNKSQSFTAYPEGSPNHPSTGQGHESAAIGGCLPIILSFSENLTDAQLKVILDTIYMWGQFRCLAGVHYGIDALVSLAAEPRMYKYLKTEIINNYTIK